MGRLMGGDWGGGFAIAVRFLFVQIGLPKIGLPTSVFAYSMYPSPRNCFLISSSSRGDASFDTACSRTWTMNSSVDA